MNWWATETLQTTTKDVSVLCDNESDCSRGSASRVNGVESRGWSFFLHRHTTLFSRF